MARLSASAVVKLLETEQAAHARTLERLHAVTMELASMKREGFAVPGAQPIFQPPLTDSIPAEVRHAIRQRADTPGELAVLEAEASRLLASKTAIEDIVKDILDGEPAEL